MRRIVRNLIATLAIIGAITFAARASAETWTLELKQLEQRDPSKGFDQAEYIYRATFPQHFFLQVVSDGKGGLRYLRNESEAAKFKAIVKKEPKYKSANPFRGVIKLGTQEFAFALDASESEPKKEEKRATEGEKKQEDKKKTDSATAASKANTEKTPSVPLLPTFDRLYFDFNHNGDLTDDKVVIGKSQSHRFNTQNTYVSLTFPRLDVTIDVGGTSVNSSIFLSANVQMSPGFGYIQVQANSAAYRSGEITLEGKKHHVVLLDFNSNGRFDDVSKIDANIHGMNGEVYPQQGDMLLIDPESHVSKSGVYESPYDPTSSDYRHNVSKLVSIDGQYYALKITPAGDKLTLEPATVACGNVTNSNEAFSALIYNDNIGILKISGKKDVPISVPEGEWKLLSYSITRMKPLKLDAASKEKSEKDAKNASVLNILKSVVGMNSNTHEDSRRFSVASARACVSYKAVKVVRGKTVLFPFGPPYKPIVTSQLLGDDKGKMLLLSMTLVGSTGEICSGVICNGTQPDKPTFTITASDGKVVQQGSFEYG